MSSNDALAPPISDPGHPVVVGSIVGMAAATAFVMVNAGGLPSPWGTLARLAWVIAVAATVWNVLLRRRRLTVAPRPSGRAGLVYAASVLGMVAGIVGGARLLVALERSELVPALVVMVVGLHFIPFARAFSAPVFGVLGWAMTALGAIGLFVGWQVSGAVVASATATIAGLVMLIVMAARAHPAGSVVPSPDVSAL